MEDKKTTKNSTEEKQPTKTYTQDELDAIVKLAVEKALSSIPQAPAQTVLKVERVTLMFLGAIANGTQVALGKLGTITKAGSTLTVPKDVFLQAMGTPIVDALLRNRSLIVMDGLTSEEMSRYNLAYDEGELLSQDAFFKIMDYPKEKVVSIFKTLCKDHKILLAKLYNTAYFENSDNRVSVELVKELNKLSKDIEKNGLFTHILEDMGKKLVE